MDIRHLITFNKICELGSFTKTAEALGYTQSTITSHIQELESHLGIAVFDRIGKNITLTNAGKELLKYSTELLSIYEKIEDIPKNIDNINGTLKIVAPESLTIYGLEPILKKYRNKFPMVTISLMNSKYSNIRDMLLNGEADIGFFLMPEYTNPDLIIHKLIEEPLLLVTAPDKKYKDIKDIIHDNILSECVIYTERNCSYRTIMEEYLSRNIITPLSTMELSSVEAIKRCVMSGMGIALLPSMAVKTEIHEKKLTVVNHNLQLEPIYSQLAYHKNKTITFALKNFLEVTLDCFSKLK